MKKVLFISGFFLIFVISISAQGTITFAKWKNNAKAAYSFDSDDYARSWYGNIPFIKSVLDTMPPGVKLTFATNGGAASPNFWDIANSTLAGNDFVNHSLTHEPHGPETFYKEYDSNQVVIEKNIPWQKCLVFVFPGGGTYTPSTFNDYIKTRRAIGTLNYGPGIGPTVASNITNPLGLKMAYYFENTLADMNKLVDDAISSGGWSLRASHQIGTTGGWGPMTADIFKQHMGYCKTKILSNDIWFSGATNIIKYIMERNNFSLQIITENDTMMVAKFITNAVEINPSQFVDNSVYDEPLTIRGTTKFGTAFQFDANPWYGNVVIKYNNTAISKITQSKYTLLPATTINVDKTTMSVSADSTSFDISATGNPRAYIISGSSWIVPSLDSVSGTKTAKVVVKKNHHNTIRWGYIAVSYAGIISKIVTVKQAASGKWMDFSQDSVKVLHNAKTASVTLNTNVSWTLSSKASWMTFSNTSGTGLKSITITLTENPDTIIRIGWIIAAGEGYKDSIKIIQAARPKSLPIIQKLKEETGIHIYPNPVMNYLIINSPYTIQSCEFFRMDGIKIREINYFHSTIDVSDLSKGIYLVKVRLVNGTEVNKMIVKE